MTVLKCMHGSSAVTDDPENFRFSLFNYEFDFQTQKSNHASVSSGRDAEGPGIYVFGSEGGAPFTEEQISAVNGYTGNNGEGSLWGAEVSMVDDDGQPIRFANTVRGDAIPAEEWASVIEDMQRRIREYHKFDKDAITELIDDLSAHWEATQIPPSAERITALVKLFGSDVDEDAIRRLALDDPHEWADEVKEQIEYADPAAFIEEVIGDDPEGFVREYIEPSSSYVYETVRKAAAEWTVEGTPLDQKALEGLAGQLLFPASEADLRPQKGEDPYDWQNRVGSLPAVLYASEDVSYDIEQLVDAWVEGDKPSKDAIASLAEQCMSTPDWTRLKPKRGESSKDWIDRISDLSGIQQLPSLWDVTKYIWNNAACANRGNSVRTYNAEFLDAVRRNVSDMSLLRVARVNNNHFYVVFDTEQLIPTCANIYTHDIDKPRLAAMIQEMNETLEHYRLDLTPEQLAMKMNALCREHFGKPLSDKLARTLGYCRGSTGIHNGAIEAMRDELSTRQELKWEEAPGVAATYQFDLKPFEVTELDFPSHATPARRR